MSSAALVHPHVERRGLAIAEPAFGPVQLGRADAEVEQHGGDRVGAPMLGHDRGQLIESGSHELHPVGLAPDAVGQAVGTSRQGVAVLVEADQA